MPGVMLAATAGAGVGFLEPVQDNPYLRAARDGPEALLNLIITEEPAASNTLNGMPDWFINDNGLAVLMSIEPCILRGIIEGDLAHRFVSKDPEVCEALNEAWTRRSQPGIYVQMQVDEEGASFSATELSIIASRMEDYCETKNPRHIRTIHRVDRCKKPLVSWNQTRLGHRKYLTNATSSATKGINVRKGKVREFADALVRRYKATPAAVQSERMRGALMEFGYSQKPGDRLQHHISHNNSNYLFNLTRAVNMVIWPGRFGLAQFVVLPLFEPEMAALAKFILNQCGQGYAAGGNGFRHPFCRPERHERVRDL